MARRATRGESGFSLAELVVVLAVIGILTAFSVPMMLTYWRTATLMAGAREVAAALNSARELAIRENKNVCVTTTDGTRLQYHLGTCGAATWKGPVTDGGGNIRLDNRVTVSATANVTFNYLGAAIQAGSYTVLSPSGAGTLSVTVVQNGRVSIP
jgi:prepilin-type N-terminal cleavage/methylation domain-containing protein